MLFCHPSRAYPRIHVYFGFGAHGESINTTECIDVDSGICDHELLQSAILYSVLCLQFSLLDYNTPSVLLWLALVRCWYSALVFCQAALTISSTAKQGLRLRQYFHRAMGRGSNQFN